MNHLFTIFLAGASLALASCASSKGGGDSCCDSKAKTECATCDSAKKK